MVGNSIALSNHAIVKGSGKAVEPKAGLDLCPTCIGFANDFINDLLNIILSTSSFVLLTNNKSLGLFLISQMVVWLAAVPTCASCWKKRREVSLPTSYAICCATTSALKNLLRSYRSKFAIISGRFVERVEDVETFPQLFFALLLSLQSWPRSHLLLRAAGRMPNQRWRRCKDRLVPSGSSRFP